MSKKITKRISTIIIMCLLVSLIIPTTTYAATKSNAKALQKAKPKITMTANDEQLTVKVNKVKYATKYQYVYATNKNFKNAKKVTTKSRTFTIKTKENKYSYDEFYDVDRGDIYVTRKIREDKNYYVKCRAVVKVNNKNYYSKWSEIKAKIITEKGYDETIPVEKAVWLWGTSVWRADGHVELPDEDHSDIIMDGFRKGIYSDTSYTSVDVYGPAGTSQEVIDAYIKAINESGCFANYNEEDIYIPCKTTVVHHKAKYKIKTL